MMLEPNKKIIPIVFAVDDVYVSVLSVALQSIIDNSNAENFYKIYILNTEISDKNKKKLLGQIKDNFQIEFVDVATRMEKINNDKIHLRDYYTKAIYFRIFIPSLFPNHEKILYLDCDVVLLDDVANLYNFNIEDNIFVAIHEETMTMFDVFGEYSEKFLGVKREKYFNSGVLLINSKEYLKNSIEEKFINFMHKYKFEVAPDQDYLNVLCKDKVKYLGVEWNKTPFKEKPFDDEKLKLVHYKLNFKPWHYDDVRFGEYFWIYAKKCPFYLELLNSKAQFTSDLKNADEIAFSNLIQTAIKYTSKEINYKNFVV